MRYIPKDEHKIDTFSPVKAPTFRAGMSTAVAGKSYNGSRRELDGIGKDILHSSRTCFHHDRHRCLLPRDDVQSSAKIPECR